MNLKKMAILALALILALSMVPNGAMAAKNKKYDADDLNFDAIIEDDSAEGNVNVYHWWTAGGEKDAIESVVAQFKEIYTGIEANSNAIPAAPAAPW